MAFIEGLQTIITVATNRPSDLEGLLSQNWLRKMMREVVSIYTVIEPIEATSCVVLRSHFWLPEALQPEGQKMETVTIPYSPSIVLQ